MSEQLNIGGLDVVAVEGLDYGRVIYAPPGTLVTLDGGQGFTTEEGSLLCSLDTYVLLDASEAARAHVQRTIVDGVREAAGVIQRADARRERRREKWVRDRQRSREGKELCLKLKSS